MKPGLTLAGARSVTGSEQRTDAHPERLSEPEERGHGGIHTPRFDLLHVLRVKSGFRGESLLGQTGDATQLAQSSPQRRKRSAKPR